MGEPILEVADLSVAFDTYEGHHRVLDGVNLSVEKGETVALVGETGCGKSVTSRAILGTLPQPPGEITAGSIRYGGVDLRSNPAEHDRVKHEEMSMIFQDPMTHLSPVFTVGTTMADVLAYRRRGNCSWWDLLRNVVGRDGTDAEAIRDRCVDILARMQIPDPEGILDRYPVELSGGMRQRVLIALALLDEPTFLIADEPTTALDVTVQNQILDLLVEHVDDRNLSMLYVTHNLGVARELADRIYVMYAGSIAESGPTTEFFDAPLHPYTRGLIDSVPKLTGFEGDGIDGRIPDYLEPPEGCRFAPRCPAAIEGTCETQRPLPVSIGAGHRVACHLYDSDVDHDTAVAIAEAQLTDDDSDSPPSAGDSTDSPVHGTDPTPEESP